MNVFLKFKEKWEKGFSMIELLIALLITSILILGTSQMTLHAIHLKRKSDCLVRSAELASLILERFKSLPFDSEELEDTEFDEIFEDERLKHVFIREWAIEGVSSNMKRIEVECFAKNHARKRTYIYLYLLKELGF